MRVLTKREPERRVVQPQKAEAESRMCSGYRDRNLTVAVGPQRAEMRRTTDCVPACRSQALDSAGSTCVKESSSEAALSPAVCTTLSGSIHEAAKRGIRDGDAGKIFNETGAVLV